jgi:hypothetical protein
MVVSVLSPSEQPLVITATDASITGVSITNDGVPMPRPRGRDTTDHFARVAVHGRLCCTIPRYRLPGSVPRR